MANKKGTALMKTAGAKEWLFADGYLPEKKGPGGMEAHEALMLFNPGTTPAQVRLDLFFEDKPPIKDIPVAVGAERVHTVRMDHANELGGVVVPPLTQYALRVRSDVPIVVQFGRLDTTQANMAYYVGVGHAC